MSDTTLSTAPICPDCNANASEHVIYKHSLLNYRGQGFVHIAWAGQRGQLTPTETRALALVLLEVAEAAEQDQIAYKFFIDKVGLPHEKAVQAIGELRQYRSA